MTYYLGIDIGTTYTAAAVWRDGRYEIANLGNRAPAIPSVVLLREDAAVLTGEAAVRRAATEPGRVAREFKRRVGDPTPIIVGGTPYSADALIAKLLRWVVDQVGDVEGGPPAGIAVSHPANWGNYKLDLLRQAISLADLDDVTTLSEPEAAAIHYASQARIEPGSVIAVYDLGGGTFDAAVLRKSEAGWDILGVPEGIERLGGVDFDQAVFHHVVQSTGGAIDALDPDDPAAHAAVARLRHECVEAKEALSSDSDVSIPVMLPNLQTAVRLTRGEYEGMVRPALADTITAMNRALRSAKVTPDEVTAVLLVGGSSRTPLVAELVSSALGRPVAVDAHPKHGVAMGAAITAAARDTGVDAGTSAAIDPEPTGTSAPATGPTGVPVVAAAAGAAGAALAGAALAGRPDRDAGDLPPTGAMPPATAPVAPVARTIAVPAAPRTAAVEPTAPGTPGRDRRSVTVPYDDPGPREPTGPRATTGRHAAQGRTQDSVRPGAGTAGRDRPPPAGSAPRGPGGNGGDPASRRPLLVALVAIAVLALLGGGAIVALSGDDDDPGSSDRSAGPAVPAGADDPSGADEADATPTDGSGDDAPADTTPTTAELPPAFVQLNSVEVEDGRYRVHYEPVGYTPDVDGDLHIHFFLNTTEPHNAGSNGNPPGDWNLTDEPSSFLTEYGPDNRGEATQMCSVVATGDHAVHTPDVTTGTCVDLPD